MTNDEIAALAGFTVAFFKSNKELWDIFQKAKKGQWDSARILASVRKTKWFKKHNEAQRQAQLLKTSDPAEYKRRLAQSRTSVRAIARQTGLGYGLSAKKQTKLFDDIANLAFLHGWNEEQIKSALARQSDVAKIIKSGGITTGLLGQGERMIRQLARDYGINTSTGTLAKMAQQYATGKYDANYLRNHFISKAKSTYAGIAAELEAGMTVREVAEPYIDAMARLWEINANDIDTTDSTLRKALTGRDDSGKPVAQPIWQFERELRQAPQWLKTNNSRETMFPVAHQVLRDMGLVV